MRVRLFLLAIVAAVAFAVAGQASACPPGEHCSCPPSGGPCPGVSKTTPAKCQATITKQLAWYASKGPTALFGKCEKSRVCGKIGICTDCPSGAGYQMWIGGGKAKVRKSIVKACAP